MQLIDQQKKIIIEGVLEAGKFLKKEFSKTQLITKRTTYDYHIAADNESEKIILQTVKESGLDCRVVTEESGTLGDFSDWEVYIDPLDGTVGYSRHIPTYAIGVGIYYKQIPQLGIIYDPAHDELFVAEKDKGATCNGKQIEPHYYSENLLIHLEWSGATLYEEYFHKLKSVGIRVRTMGSGVLSFCYACIGRGDGIIAADNSPWDVAAGLVFAAELGLEYRQLNGQAVDLHAGRQHILCAPKELFARLSML